MKSKELSMLDQSKKMCAEIFCTSTRELFPHSLGIAVEHIIGIFCATVQGLFPKFITHVVLQQGQVLAKPFFFF